MVFEKKLYRLHFGCLANEPFAQQNYKIDNIGLLFCDFSHYYREKNLAQNVHLYQSTFLELPSKMQIQYGNTKKDGQLTQVP